MHEWDPIDVRDDPRAADEYDPYVSQLTDMLFAGASDQAVAEYLYKIETDGMQLGGDFQRALTVAGLLRRISLNFS